MGSVKFKTTDLPAGAVEALAQLLSKLNSSNYRPSANITIAFTTDATKIVSLWNLATRDMKDSKLLTDLEIKENSIVTREKIRGYIEDNYNGFESKHTSYIYVSPRLLADGNYNDLIGTAIHEYLHRTGYPSTDTPDGYHNKGFYGRVVEIAKALGYTVPDQQGKYDDARCFLAGTPILMADGSEKPVEEIEVGDEVMSFDPFTLGGKGERKGKKVTRLFRNQTKSVLDLHGLKITPGHVVLTDHGEWLTIARVLKADRSVVRDIEGKPRELRARTGAPVGSTEDIPVGVVFADPATGRRRVARVRAGIPALAFTPAGSEKTELWTLGRVLTYQNYRIEADGTMINEAGTRFGLTPWPGSHPFESQMMENWIVSVDDIPFTPRWIAELPFEDEKGQAAINAASLFDPAHSGRSGMNRHERRKMASLRVIK